MWRLTRARSRVPHTQQITLGKLGVLPPTHSQEPGLQIGKNWVGKLLPILLLHHLRFCSLHSKNFWLLHPGGPSSVLVCPASPDAVPSSPGLLQSLPGAMPVEIHPPRPISLLTFLFHLNSPSHQNHCFPQPLYLKFKCQHVIKSYAVIQVLEWLQPLLSEKSFSSA